MSIWLVWARGWRTGSSQRSSYLTEPCRVIAYTLPGDHTAGLYLYVCSIFAIRSAHWSQENTACQCIIAGGDVIYLYSSICPAACTGSNRIVAVDLAATRASACGSSC